VTEIAIDRASFASEYADVPWSALPPVPMQPARHRAAFVKVAEAIGIARATMSPRQVIFQMVGYFRSFAPADDAPTGQGDIYLDLALSKKGVCRHRAFAFFVTALNIGIPTRLIHNEAHAWVEVRDDRLWRRIDLGGAALDLADDPHLDRPSHVPPPDQFAWPTGRDSGADLAHRRRTEAQRAEQAAAAAAKDQAASGNDPSATDPLAPPDPAAASQPPRPVTSLTLEALDAELFRGKPLRLSGRASAEGRGCPFLRVDVVLAPSGGGARRHIGSLSTDERGVYQGAVVLPRDLPIGDHDLSVLTAGSRRCGPGRQQ
jgi:hypothetical protein